MNAPAVMDAPQQDPEDAKLYVQFYMGAVVNDEKSATEGHPVYDSIPFVKILVPGDRNTTIDTRAGELYPRRFPMQWAAFKRNEDQAISGFPLREWPAVTRAQAEEMAHLNVYTVEQLSTLPDVYGSKLMGFQDLKRKAETFLAAAKDSAFVEKVSAENANLKLQLDATQQELARLSKAFDEFQKGKGK
jgi:hypothetical protein